jgi:tRNA modification GTPase
LRVWVEATLDFPEDDVELLARGNVREKLTGIEARLRQITAASQQGHLLREGVHIVLAGHPNVGKSSLLNALAGAERAIVTDIPGTTRDTIREQINLEGIPLHIIDTAGLREPRDAVEKIGIAKTWEAVRAADLVLWVSDVSRPETSLEDPMQAAQLPADLPCVHIFNKIDLDGLEPYQRTAEGVTQLGVSAKSGAGLDLLKAAILATAGWSHRDEGIFMARERHLEALQMATSHLQLAAATMALELLAEELRLAQTALNTITGELTADDLLGRIFSHFCIGK